MQQQQNQTNIELEHHPVVVSATHDSSTVTHEDHHEHGLISGVKERLEHCCSLGARLQLVRAVFAMIVLAGFVLGIIFRDGFFTLYWKIPNFHESCQRMQQVLYNSCIGSQMAYRISFALVIFFLVHVFMTSKLFMVGDRIRLLLQYHPVTWVFRCVFLAIVLVGTFFIPNVFFYVYAWIAMFLSAFFLLFQIILLIDFAYSWFESWRNACPEDQQVSKWDIFMFIIAICLFVLDLAIIVLQFVFFGSGPDCHRNRVFIIFNISFVVLLVIVALVIKKGVFVPSVCITYSTVTLFSAFLSDPHQQCNWLFSESQVNNAPAQIITLILGLLLCGFSLYRATFGTSQYFSSLFDLSRKDPEEEEAMQKANTDAQTSVCCPHLPDHEDEAKKMDLECKELLYSHLAFMLASGYIAMILANWKLDPATPARAYVVEESETAVYVKVAVSIVTNALFLWTLIAPKLLKRCRDFQDNK